MVATFAYGNAPKRHSQPGTSKPDSPLAAAFARGKRAKEQILGACGGTLTSYEMAERLSVSPPTVYRWRTENKLFWMKPNGKIVYPKFQLTEGGLLQGIYAVLSALEVDDPWMQINFMLTGDFRLNQETPLSVLKRGEIEAVVRAARAFGSQGAA